MAIGVPIIGQNFGDIANQIGYWDRRNQQVIEANMARRAAQENAVNNWFANMANLTRADTETGYNRALTERQRGDVLREADIERARRAYEFKAQQDLSREQNRLGVEMENARIAANRQLNEQRATQTEAADRWDLVAEAVGGGRRLAEFDVSGFSPTELQRLKNLEDDYSRQTMQDRDIASEMLAAVNRNLMIARRVKTAADRTGDDVLSRSERAELEAEILGLPVTQLSKLGDKEMAAALEGAKLGQDFFRMARFNPDTQQYELRPQSWFNSTTTTGTNAPAAAAGPRRIGRFSVTVE